MPLTISYVFLKTSCSLSPHDAALRLQRDSRNHITQCCMFNSSGVAVLLTFLYAFLTVRVKYRNTFDVIDPIVMVDRMDLIDLNDPLDRIHVV